jgi:hypothetical protein
MSTTSLFDTAKAVQRLEDSGMPREQALAIIRILVWQAAQNDLRGQPGCPEHANTKADIDTLRSTLDLRFASLEKRLDAIPRFVIKGLVAFGLLHVLLNVFGLIRHWFSG